jgi:hypothetical protein
LLTLLWHVCTSLALRLHSVSHIRYIHSFPSSPAFNPLVSCLHTRSTFNSLFSSTSLAYSSRPLLDFPHPLLAVRLPLACAPLAPCLHFVCLHFVAGEEECA